MSTDTHTPGRLHVGGSASQPPIIYAADGWAIANVTVFHGRFRPGESGANAHRLVACWNACAGMSTELLQNIATMGETLLVRFKLRDQAEHKLLAALTDIATNGDPHGLRARKALMEHGTSSTQPPT